MTTNSQPEEKIIKLFKEILRLIYNDEDFVSFELKNIDNLYVIIIKQNSKNNVAFVKGKKSYIIKSIANLIKVWGKRNNIKVIIQIESNPDFSYY